ncbi:hypothetical protein BGX26_001187 [Mortierella sp. AD094]|nr:hypothetical protein BGX26_001187 [Mortierella sp. AD094]
MNASCLSQSSQHSASSQTTDPRISALTSTPNDPATLVLLADPSSPPTQAAASAGFNLTSSSSNIATATARPTPSFGSGFFAAAQDPSKHLASQLPLETPFFTPQASWTEHSRSDYFSASSTPAHMASATSHIASPTGMMHPSQANLFASGFSLPAQTPAAIEIPSFAASSPSYFPSSDQSNTASDQEPGGFQLPPSTLTLAIDRNGSSASIPMMHRPNLPLSMPLSSLMMSPTNSSSSFSLHSPTSSRLSMSSLSGGSHHSPAPAAPPAELKLQVMNCDTVSRLLEQVLSNNSGDNGSNGTNGDSNGGDRNAVMLLDMRPSVSHAASSILTAVNVCIPNMLLKRPNYSLQMVTEQLTTEQDIENFSRWRHFSNIVLFDASGAAPVVGSPTFFMVQKFRKEGCNATIAYLHGGFNEFSVKQSGLCRTDANPNSGGGPTGIPAEKMSLSLSSSPTPMQISGLTGAGSSSIVSPSRQRLHLGSLPSLMTQPPGGPLGCQTPMIENPNVNPLFESVRQAMGLSTNITEEIPVRLPMGFTVQTMYEYLPNWLLSAISEDSGKSRLAEYFQNMRSGRTTNFSIGAGIEQGLKNRYNNIWPYDHTRVKIGEVDPGHDDYINASFLTPLLSKKSYIATQGPLPSTFQDFWKAAWEQNSRVVVMLTREQEMGRIKCHEYWPTARQPIMDLGSMRVTFITEFLPDPTIGTILVRQLKLRHIHHPESEERNITQIQYTGWPDFGVPETPLEVLRVIQLANEYNNNNTPPASLAGPMIVHCSAGCGRTGAFCVIDSILTELKEHPTLVMQPSGGGGAGATSTSRLSLSSKPSLEFSRSGNDRVANAMSNSGGGPGSGRPQLQLGSLPPSGLSLSSTPGSTSGTSSGTSSGSSSSGSSSSTAVNDDVLSDIVYTSVSTFREQRISMVQTLRQYVFCYEAIFWHLAMEFAKERPNLGLMVVPPPSLAVHTPLLPLPPQSNPALSMGNAPITTTSEEFSFFG